MGAVVSLRRSLGPYLLPDVFFAEVSPELPVSCVEVPEDLLFRFIGGSPSRARSLGMLLYQPCVLEAFFFNFHF